MADFPTFFFSHARQDRGRYLLQFFEDLEKKLARWTGINLEIDQHLGTIDNRIPHSDDWDENLSHGLSSDNTFIAILSPTYFGRLNCGKELSVFLLRSSKLGIDRNGSLTGVENVMPIRWYPEVTYAADGIKDHLIPEILRLIEDAPAARAGDPERNRAIEKYRKKGMERCVRRGNYYDELLDAFVEAIRDMEKLASRPIVRFADAFDAFNYDWFRHFKVSPPAGQPAAVRTDAPTPLTSIVAFYVTGRPLNRYAFPVDFADYLIAEPIKGESTTDPTLSALFADIRKAGVAEGFSVYHAASDPAVPSDPTRLLTYLVRLSQARICPILVVDPAVEVYGSETPERKALNKILSSPDWTGVVVSPTLDGNVPKIADLITASEMKTPVLAIPENSEERVAELSRAFFRLRVLSTTSTNGTSEGEKPPTLQGPRADNI
jgi:hypothetical protein